MKLEPGMHLYHGSYAAIEEIDLSRCANGKDFGRGFYLTSQLDQAARFVKTSLVKAQNIGGADASQHHGFVSEFRYAPDRDLSVVVLSEANAEWLRFVSLNRRRALADLLASKVDEMLKIADIGVGKVADDGTNATITAYLSGLYGPVGEDRAAMMAISLLMPENLTDQYCFRTQAAIYCLRSLRVTHCGLLFREGFSRLSGSLRLRHWLVGARPRLLCGVGYEVFFLGGGDRAYANSVRKISRCA